MMGPFFYKFMGYACVFFCFMSSLITLLSYWTGHVNTFTSPFVYFCLAAALLRKQ
jgi:hypothetical protein